MPGLGEVVAISMVRNVSRYFRCHRCGQENAPQLATAVFEEYTLHGENGDRSALRVRAFNCLHHEPEPLVCDWGHCNKPAFLFRLDKTQTWLPVCDEHAKEE